MINWNEVKVGETVIVNDGGCQWSLLARWGDYVLVGYANDMGRPWVEHIDDLSDWTIYDPWEDVSEECSINEWGRVEHKGEIIDFKPNVYKRSEKGLRVWKRKEGRDE